MNGWDFSQKSAVLTCLPYTQDDRSGWKITKSLDFSILLRCFVLRQKRSICKFRLRFCKSVQTFHAKVVCPTFWDRPPLEVAFLAERFLWLQRCRYWDLRKPSLHFGTRAELVYKCFLLNIGMLTAKQMIVTIAVTIMAAIYSFDWAIPYIKELPSINRVGRYLFAFGSKPTI